MKPILAALLVLLTARPLSAADSFLGTWRMTPNGIAGDKSQQVQTITPVGDGVKVDVEIDFGNGTKMSMTYTTKPDGAEVPVYSSGKVVMMFRAKRAGANTYEGSMTANGMTTNFHDHGQRRREGHDERVDDRLDQVSQRLRSCEVRLSGGRGIQPGGFAEDNLGFEPD